MSDQTAQPDGSTFSRRGLLRAAGASAAVLGGGGLLDACSSSIKGASSSSTSSSGSGGTQDIVIGFIHPLTGDLADFGTSDNWIVSTIQATSQYKNGFKVGGKTYPVTIKSYDTQSDPTRAGQLASQAILTDKVDLIVTSSTPETVNPVATVTEKLGTPTICGNVKSTPTVFLPASITIALSWRLITVASTVKPTAKSGTIPRRVASLKT